MSVTLMTTVTPRAGDEENRFLAHYSEADQMARFSSTGGCRYNNGSDRVTLLVIYIANRVTLSLPLLYRQPPMDENLAIWSASP